WALSSPLTVTFGRAMSGAGPSTWPAGAISAASGDAGPPQPAMPSRTPVHSNARPLARKTPPGNPFRPTADLPLGYPSQYAHDHARPEPPRVRSPLDRPALRTAAPPAVRPRPHRPGYRIHPRTHLLAAPGPGADGCRRRSPARSEERRVGKEWIYR